MKKFAALLLLFFFTATENCYAVSALYYVKSIKTENAAPVIRDAYQTNKYHLLKENPYYGVPASGDDNVVIITQQSGDNMFYYYRSDDNIKVNKYVQKEFKRMGLTVEQSFNTGLIEIYEKLADEVSSGTQTLKTYNFEEPQTPAFEPPTDNTKTYNQPEVFRGYVTQISSGTKFQAYLQNAINTATASKGDQIIAVLTNPLMYNGIEVAPQGTLIYGSLSKARPAAYGSRNGRVVINFNRMVTPENKTYDISTEEIDFTVSNEGKVGESLKSAAGAAVAGALVGLLFSALSGGHDHMGRSAAIGAGVAAGSSVIYSTAERGVDAEIPSYTELEITLTQPISVSVGY